MIKILDSIIIAFGLLCLVLFIGYILLIVNIYFNFKNELHKELTPSEYDSLVTDQLYYPSFHFIRNGERWNAFSLGDGLNICKWDNCGG
jgi:hypothetical protein